MLVTTQKPLAFASQAICVSKRNYVHELPMSGVEVRIMRKRYSFGIFSGATIVGLAYGTTAVGQLPETLALRRTGTTCEVVGLGAVGTVPFNFPGADAESTARYRAEMNPGIVESTLPPGLNSSAPAILGTDLGAPFMHGDGRMYFTFGDAWFESPARQVECPASSENCIPGVENNDVLAYSERYAPGSGCIQLEATRSPGTPHVQPITWGGPASDGGHRLGTPVPGPGFSTGSHLFILMSVPAPVCGATQHNCGAANGLATDVCRLDFTGEYRCYFGDCSDEPTSPCALRFNPSTLLVRTRDAEFTEPTVGVHIESERVLQAYRGHFSAVTFFSEADPATGTGRVWVLGRDSFWGTPGLPMSPYLMFHPVEQGRLGEPLFFAGFKPDGDPRFSREAAEALPLYTESVMVPQHTSLVFEPEVHGGTWLMLYGGHAQPVLRGNIGLFVRPVVDDMFYARGTGIYLRWAKSPWGPWSEAVQVFNPFMPGHGGYCEQMHFADAQGLSGFSCPPGAAEHNERLNRAAGLGSAGEYGAAIVPGATEALEEGLRVRWLMSTWNPYRVVMQESDLSHKTR